MIQKDYVIAKKTITTRNSQSNVIIKRLHQTIGNMIQTFRVHKTKLDEEDPWSGILRAVMFATRTTFHSTNRAKPAQLVFGCNAILNVKHKSDWAYIKKRKDKISLKNNIQENKKRKKYDYNVNNKVLIKEPKNLKYGTDAYTGPFKIVKMNNNGTVTLKKGCIEDVYNIRNLKPYYN